MKDKSTKIRTILIPRGQMATLLKSKTNIPVNLQTQKHFNILPDEGYLTEFATSVQNV
jgi:hypothetical protein